MTDLERSIAAYAEFLDEASRARSADHDLHTEDERGDVIVVDIGTLEKTTDERVWRRWQPWTLLTAAAVIVVIVAIAAFSGAEESSPTDVVDSPDDTGAPEPPAMDTSQPWDLVFISDGEGLGVANRWAERIQLELGVEVRVHNHVPLPGDHSAVYVRDFLDEPGSALAEQIADAEVVAVFANPLGSGVSGQDAGACISTSIDPRDPPQLYSAEDFVPYGEVLSSIFATVFELRKGAPTIVRAMDAYVPVVDAWHAAGVQTECMAMFELISETTRSAAAGFGVPMASMFDAFNGPDHDEDPNEKGFLDGGGGYPSAKGKDVMVEALHSLGYEPTGQAP
jgi:hypothetical protein